jgi:MFS family permease
VAELVPAKIRGAAFGYYNGVAGLGLLPASLLFGWVSTTRNPSTAFFVGAVLATFGFGLLLFVKPKAN